MNNNDFHQLLLTRHSIRRYTSEPLTPEEVKTILEAALLAPTSKNARSWHFTVVDHPDLLAQLAQCKPLYAHSIGKAPLAIVVSANPELSDVWVEDASVAATLIHLQVEALGLGSCWIQVRNRMHDDETTASEWVKELLGIDGAQQVVCILSIGHKDEQRRPVDPEKLKWDHVTIKTAD